MDQVTLMDTQAAVNRTFSAACAILETRAQIQDLLKAYLPRGFACVCFFFFFRCNLLYLELCYYTNFLLLCAFHAILTHLDRFAPAIHKACVKLGHEG